MIAALAEKARRRRRGPLSPPVILGRPDKPGDDVI